MATTSEQLPALAETQSKIPWYVQDLPLYLKGFGILTVIYIGLPLSLNSKQYPGMRRICRCT